MKHDCVIKFYNSQYFYFIEISENYNDCKDTTVEYYLWLYFEHIYIVHI